MELTIDLASERLIILLAGPPATGKSTIALNLSSHMRELGMTVSYIDYDMYEIDREDWDEHSFAKSRESALTAFKNCLADPSTTVVIVDDIMIYSSMRRLIHRIANEAGFICVTVYTTGVSLETALSRNARRSEDTQVSEMTIRKAFEAFDIIESSHRAGFEKFSVPVESMSNVNVEKTMSLILEAGAANKRRLLQKTLENLEQEAGRRETETSVLHGLDIALRGAVGKTMGAISRGEGSTASSSSGFFSLRDRAREVAKLLRHFKDEALKRAREELQSASDLSIETVEDRELFIEMRIRKWEIESHAALASLAT
jgi:tRNA uridine 5-carbamoylmethylation protein Kti12